MGDERNRLNKAQKYKLTAWIEKNLPRFAEESITSSRAAELGTTELGFPVTQDNVTSIAGRSKEAIFEHQWPGLQSSGGSSGNHADRRLQVVVEVVRHILANTSNPVLPPLPAELAILWNELVHQCRVPVAEDTFDPAPDPTL